MRRRRTEAAGGYNVWPVFTDALSGLVTVLVFLVTVFVIGETWLAREVSGRDDAIGELRVQLARLHAQLGLSERRAQVAETRAAEAEATIGDRELDLADLRAALAQAEATRLRLNVELERSRHALDDQQARQLQEREAATVQTRTLGEERAALLARAAAQAQALDASEDRRRTAEAGIAELNARLARLQTDLERLQQALALAEDQRRQDDEAHAAALAAGRRQAAAALAQAEAALAAGQQRAAAELDTERQAAAERLAALAAEKEQLERERLALAGQLDEQATALAATQTRLAERDATVTAQAERLDELDRQVRLRLVERVEQLSRYASEFFGRLRTLFEDDPDIRVVGDRFVFQSEVLFGSGEAALTEAGKPDLDKFAGVYRQLSGRLPEDLPVIIEIIGHTDRAPIRASRFRSNWELSTARAQAVVDYLIRQGIPPQRLAAVGMGEFHPVDSAETPEAYRRNRRIELKITSR
ncbi:OmpA family protein [Plasticicumulans sp.]|uniref:OmpA family protein n=1 Tax=Plasticicumulans sp. TaxID=2307179 RepID=UPI00395904D5